MKIVVISSIFRPYRRGGAEVMVEGIVDQLRYDGHEVVVFAISEWRGWRSLWSSKEQVDGMTVYRWYPANIFSYLHIGDHTLLSRVLWHLIDMVNIHSYLVVRWLLARESPDVVLGHVIKGFGYLVPRTVCASGFRYIQTVHDIQLLFPSGLLLKGQEDLLNKPLFRWYRTVTRWLLGSPGTVLFPSRFLAELHQRYGFFPYSAAKQRPNPILSPMVSNIRAVPSDTNIDFLYVGQLEPAKGVEWLISSFMARAEPEWRLVIAGSGSLESKLVALTQNDSRIVMMGRQAAEQLSEIYGKAAFLIVPPLCYENDPLVISEAFLVGTPVLAADIGGVSECIVDGKNGYLFTAGDQESLILAMQRVVVAIRTGAWEEMSRAASDSVRGQELSGYLASIIDQTNTP